MFASLLHKFSHDPENHILNAFGLFHHYYCASFANRKYKIDPNSKISNLENTLWDIRDLHGKEFMDRAMFATIDRWESGTPKDANFETFFTARFLLAVSVEDTGAQHQKIRQLLQQRSLYYLAQENQNLSCVRPFLSRGAKLGVCLDRKRECGVRAVLAAASLCEADAVLPLKFHGIESVTD